MVVFYGEIRATAVSAEWSSANCEVEEKKCVFSDTPSSTVLGLHLLYTATADSSILEVLDIIFFLLFFNI